MSPREFVITGYTERQIQLESCAFRQLGSDLGAPVGSLGDQEFIPVRRLGNELRIGASTDQREGLRRALHHRTSMTVAVGAQCSVGRRRPELQPEICQRPVFDVEQYRPPFRIQDRDGGVAADRGYPVLRPVQRGEKVAAATVLVFEATFQCDQLGFQRPSIDGVENAFGLLDGFGPHPFEQFASSLDRTRLEIGPSGERAQTAVDLRQGSGSEVVHHQARLGLHFRGFVRKRARLALLDCEPRLHLQPSVDRLRGARDAVHDGLAKCESVRARRQPDRGGERVNFGPELDLIALHLRDAVGPLRSFFQSRVQLRERFKRFTHDGHRRLDFALAEPTGCAGLSPVLAPRFLRQPGVAELLLAEPQVTPSILDCCTQVFGVDGAVERRLTGRQHRGDVVILGDIDPRRTQRLGDPLPRTIRFDLRFTTFPFGRQQFSMSLDRPVALPYPQI